VKVGNTGNTGLHHRESDRRTFVLLFFRTSVICYTRVDLKVQGLLLVFVYLSSSSLSSSSWVRHQCPVLPPLELEVFWDLLTEQCSILMFKSMIVWVVTLNGLERVPCFGGIYLLCLRG
jgi:hypothetical protein